MNNGIKQDKNKIFLAAVLALIVIAGIIPVPRKASAALSRTNIGSWTSATTGSFTPPANSILIVFVHRTAATNGDIGQNTISGGGLTYNHIGQARGESSWAIRADAFYAEVGGSPSSMTITVDNPGITIEGWRISVVAFTGYNTSSPIAGFTTSNTSDIGDGSESQTLAATPAIDDVTLFAIGVDADGPGVSPVLASGWSIIHDVGDFSGLATARRENSTSTTVTVTDAYNAGGAVYKASMFSFIVKAAAGGDPPSAPSGLSAQAISATEINLSWADNSDNENNFELERCSGSGCSGFSNILNPAANSTSTQNSDLSPATLYRYRIRACNAAGCSSYSNIAEATTDALTGPLHDQTITATNAAGATSVSTSISTGGTDRVLLATVSYNACASDAANAVQSITTTDITWQRVAGRRDGGGTGNRVCVEVWSATSSAQLNGASVNVSFGGTTYRAVLVVSAYSGADMSNPTGATCTNGGASASTSANGLSCNITTLYQNSLVTGHTAQRQATAHTAGTDYTANAASTSTTNGTSNNNVTAIQVRRSSIVSSTSTVAVNATTNSTQRWAIAGVEVRAASGEPPPDTTPPSPDPMTWSSTPAASSTTAIIMTATTANDTSTPPVSYLFTYSSSCPADNGTGGASSTWQSGTTYTNTGLDVNKCYTYAVKARDSAGTPNETANSATSSAYTFANIPSAPTISSPTTSTLNFSNNANGNPSNTLFAIQVTSTSPTDSSMQGHWITSTGATSAMAVWMSDADADALSGANAVKNLKANTTYTFTVKARNGDSLETAQSATASGKTLPNTPGTPTYSSVSSSTLTVSWTAPTGGADTYKIERATSSQVYAQVASGISGTTYNATATPNTTWFFRIRGTNSSGDGPYSATSSQLMLPAEPGTPTYTNVGTSTLTVSWASSTNGASFWRLERATSTQVYAEIATTTATSRNETGLATSTTYFYRVRGNNATGNGPYSASSSATTGGEGGGSAPSAPTLNSPTDGAQNQPTTPVFKMTATDPDGDYLQYKVTIYSNSGCTTVVQTNDQSASQAGWSGQNASSSAAYTSGTQGTFTVQSALSQNTTYYWKASAKDPDGSGTFTNASECRSFTTTSGRWTSDQGEWSIVSNQLMVAPASGSSVQLHVTGESRADAVIEFKAKASAVGANTGNTGGIARANSAGSVRYWLGVADVLGGRHSIAKTSSTYSVLASSTFSFAADAFYQFRGRILGTQLNSWINGGAALSTTDSSISGAGFLGLAASSTAGTITFTYDNFAVYASSTITLQNLPGSGSWAVRNAAGARISACATASTLDFSNSTSSIPVDYDSGGGSVAVWTGNTTCSGAPTVTYPSSGLAADIFGGDVYKYNAAAAGGSDAVLATSTITISATGLISL